MADEYTLSWKLSDPGMNFLELAGLAGLYMSLRAVEGKEHDFSPLRWELAPDSGRSTGLVRLGQGLKD